MSYSQRETYIKAQVASIAEVFGERYNLPVQLDRGLEYLYLPRFPLPKRWGERETPLLIHIPREYPQVPPHGFFLSKKCHGPHVYSREMGKDSEDFSIYGWNWFCIYCDQGWKPGPSPLDPHNLWTFINAIRVSLTIEEF